MDTCASSPWDSETFADASVEEVAKSVVCPHGPSAGDSDALIKEADGNNAVQEESEMNETGTEVGTATMVKTGDPSNGTTKTSTPSSISWLTTAVGVWLLLSLFMVVVLY